ncbi:hypothetical protein NLM33_09385 [Bradyrhizobium sp. CCGUVB1N3]|uniref:hypothetical protein n=1 Tax=Bradyrhizobium sp. CCGUVB1N3 TaxID=2949629 RepID=UPI0020B350C4|nr:hypothetical protein [Bradyrhizobium sp. CCGUVB1N3]MCP3470534.1 hypothetical protein [Bradyrhizobium sp. CCGUVB1N3]
MNWAWANSLDEIWRSPGFPMWLTLAAAGFFGLILLITLLRAERSVANGALTVIALLAIGIAVAATMRAYGPGREGPTSETRAQPVTTAALPALSCIDDLAGDTVLAACEKALFGSPEAAAAAVSYTAAQISRLTALGDVAAAGKNPTPELKALRRAIERDRYGLVAQVLAARDGCTQFDCAAFRSLTDQQHVAANMDAHIYDGLVARYAATWNVPATPMPGAIAGLSPSVPTGKPTNAEFPSAASTPAVSIMAPEPPARSAPSGTAAAPAAPRAPAAATSAQASAPPPAAKKPPAPKAARAPASAPVQIAPAAQPAPAPAPAAADNN